jgi:integrase
MKLRAVLKGDLEFLRLPIEVSLGTGMRKRIELLRLKGEHINFGVRPIFFKIRGGDVEVPPSWLIVVQGKGKQVPLDSYELCGSVCAGGRKWGFEEACTRAGIVYGETKPGGIIWHDLRRTFATRLRANGVHEYDIQDLMGHASPESRRSMLVRL